MQVVAQAGIASRRAAEDLVTSGLVKVNGKVVMVPQHMVLASVDTVRLSCFNVIHRYRSDIKVPMRLALLLRRYQ